MNLSVSFADQGKWYDSQPISQISIESPFGTQSDLNQLLTSQLGESLSLNKVQQDIRTLYLAGHFSEVQVDAIPLFLNGLSDKPTVHLIYSVKPAPILSNVNIESNYRRVKSLLLDKLPLSLGRVFYFSNEKSAIKSRINSILREHGFSDLEIQFKLVTNEDLRVDLNITVNVQKENRIHSIRYVGIPQSMQNEIKLLLWSKGVSVGNRTETSKLRELKQTIKELLFQEGWLQARVNFPYVPNSNGDTVLTLRIETGPQYIFTTQGGSLPTGLSLLKMLDIYPGDRIRPSDGKRLSSALKNQLKLKGYNDATINIRIDGNKNKMAVVINVDLGLKWSIKSLDFKGNNNFTNNKLKELIKESSALINQDIYNDKEWKTAISTLIDVYKGQGYLDVSIDCKQSQSIGRNILFETQQQVELSCDINEGAQYLYGKINFNGGNDSILNSLEIKSGDVYRPKKIKQITQLIISQHQELGFLNATATSNVAINKNSKDVDLTFNIELGEMVRLRSIIIKGNNKTKMDVVSNALSIRVGYPLRLTDLNATRQNLYSLDLFKNIQIERFGDDSDQQDLVVNLEEKPNWLFTLGGGVTTDQGVQLAVSAEHRNLAGRANRFKFLASAGIGWEGDTWRLDLQEQLWRVALRFNAPNFYDTSSEFFSEVLLQELIQEPNYNFFRSGVGLGFRLQQTERVKTFAEYRLNRIEIDEFNTGMLVDGDPWLSIDGLTRWSSGPSLSLIYDGRDNPVMPTTGDFLSALLHLSDGLASSVSANTTPIRFLKFYTDASKIIKFDGFSFKLSAAGGIAYSGPESTVPFDERFYLGGINSLRGFNRNSVGPANITTRPNISYPNEISNMIDETTLRTNPTQWVATGGDYVTRVSAELQYPLTRFGWEKLSIISFYDLGKIGFLSDTVYANSENQTGIEEPPYRYGVGLGVRISTPVGPVTLDIGLNPSRMPERDEPFAVFTMSMGSM